MPDPVDAINELGDARHRQPEAGSVRQHGANLTIWHVVDGYRAGESAMDDQPRPNDRHPVVSKDTQSNGGCVRQDQHQAR